MRHLVLPLILAFSTPLAAQGQPPTGPGANCPPVPGPTGVIGEKPPAGGLPGEPDTRSKAAQEAPEVASPATADKFAEAGRRPDCPSPEPRQPFKP